MARRAQKYTVKPKKSHKKITSIGVAGYKPDGRGLKAIGDTHFLKYDSRLGSSWQHGMFEEGGHGYGADDYDKDDEDGGDWEDIVQRILRTVKGERKRKKDGVRMALAKNWERIEAWMASYQLHRFEEVTPCDCKGFYDVEVNMISFASLTKEMVQYCVCGQKCAQMINRGMFPSTPVRPQTLFAVEVLQLYHLQSVRGSISKTAWAEGLREQLELKGLKVIPHFAIKFRNAYHHWVAVEYKINTILDTLLGDTEVAQVGGRRSDWREESLANICPPCFDFSSFPADQTVSMSVDGNMQHGRFKDVNPCEFEVLPTKLFVDNGKRDFALASERRAGEKSGNESACGHLFKATKEWSKVDDGGSGAIPGAKNFDEKGLVGLVCLHGTSLRYLNIFTGERQTHVTTLLQNVLLELPDIKMLRLCYDVACVFGPALKELMPAEAERIQARIGRFHIYGHGMSCFTLCNLIRSSGWGLMVGEENEYDWSRMAHFVASGRVSSAPRRTQRIDSYGIYTARAFKERMGTILTQRLRNALRVISESEALLHTLIGTVLPPRVLKNGEQRPEIRVDLEYLMQQAADQEEYYRTYKKPIPDPRDIIFDQLLKEAMMAQNIAQQNAIDNNRGGRQNNEDPGPRGGRGARGARGGGARGGNQHRGVRNALSGLFPPISFAELSQHWNGSKVVKKTNDLMAQCGDTREDWREGGEYHTKYKNSYHLRTLHGLQTEIIRIVTTRAAEISTITRRIRGNKQSTRFKAQINSRWKALDTTVSDYNREILKLTSRDNFEPPRKLSVEELKKNGISNDEVWDLDRMFTRSDWAALIDVREGILAMYRIQRAQEEIERLGLHAQRMGAWLLRQSLLICTLLENFNDLMPEASYLSPSHLKAKLFSRLRMIQSMLKVKPNLNLLTEDLRNDLSGLEQTVKSALLMLTVERHAPFQRAGRVDGFNHADIIGDQAEEGLMDSDNDMSDDDSNADDLPSGIEGGDLMEDLGEALVREETREFMNAREADDEGDNDGLDAYADDDVDIDGNSDYRMDL